MQTHLSVLYVKLGCEPVIKGPWADSPAGHQLQLAAIIELNKLYPTATIVALETLPDGRVLAESDKQCLALGSESEVPPKPADLTITVHDGNGNNPTVLTKVQYAALCRSGMLWEFHPDAPQHWPHLAE